MTWLKILTSTWCLCLIFSSPTVLSLVTRHIRCPTQPCQGPAPQHCWSRCWRTRAAKILNADKRDNSVTRRAWQDSQTRCHLHVCRIVTGCASSAKKKLCFGCASHALLIFSVSSWDFHICFQCFKAFEQLASPIILACILFFVCYYLTRCFLYTWGITISPIATGRSFSQQSRLRVTSSAILHHFATPKLHKSNTVQSSKWSVWVPFAWWKGRTFHVRNKDCPVGWQSLPRQSLAQDKNEDKNDSNWKVWQLWSLCSPLGTKQLCHMTCLWRNQT